MNMCKIFFPFHYKVLINLVTRKMFKTGYTTFTTESLASEEESFDKKPKKKDQVWKSCHPLHVDVFEGKLV